MNELKELVDVVRKLRIKLAEILNKYD